MARTPEETLDLANKAVRTVTRGHTLWTLEDWADMQQEAALAILKLDPEAHEGVCVLAAKNAAYSWMRLWLRTPRAGILLDWVDYSAPTDQEWPLDYLEELLPMLEAQRAEKAEEDVWYLRLLLRGYSTAGVARVMRLSERRVYAIRERLLPRLERIARHEPPPPWVVNVRESSRQALDRINSDPAALARRGDAIRAGCARKKQERVRVALGDG